MVSLYPNVDKNDAVIAVMELFVQHYNLLNHLNIKPEHFHDLLLVLLDGTIFTFNGQLYTQLRGLPMGHRFAPFAAIAFMHKIETTVTSTLRINLFTRYIDDIFVLTDDENELESLYKMLNNSHETIKLTREDPTEKGLAFLNCNIKGFKNDKFITTEYRKPTSKNIILNAN